MKKVRIQLILLLSILTMLLLPGKSSAETPSAWMEKEPIGYLEPERRLQSSTQGISWQYEWEGKPNGAVGNPSPLITYFIKITGDADYKVRMLIDGRPVQSKYDPMAGNLTYQTSNLSGTHTVSVKLDVYGSTYDITSWDFVVDPTPVNPFANQDVAFLSSIQQDAISRMNAYRTPMSLPLLTASETLQKAAQAHSNYLFFNNTTGHNEILGRIGFTGVRPWDRAGYYGFTGSAGEGITYRKRTGLHGIDELLDAPYHRLSIIDPLNSTAGTGYNSLGDIVVNYGKFRTQEKRSETVLYPYNHQQDAKVSWFVAESPNPLRFWDIDKTYVGYPISYAYFTDDSRDTLHVKTLSLKNSEGRDIPFYDVTPDRDTQGKHHVFLIPKSPLIPDETYTVSVGASVTESEGNETDVSRTWSFTTASAVDINDIYFITSNNFTYLRVNWQSGEDPDAVIRLEQDGKLFIKKEGNSQWTYNQVTEGDYQLIIESPMYGEIKTIPIRIKRNHILRYKEDSEWAVERLKDQQPDVDTMPPVISGAEDQMLELNTPFDPLTGVTAIDETDGDVTQTVTVEGIVDTSKAGSYVLTYRATDRSGNTAVKTRIIIFTRTAGLPDYVEWLPEKTVGPFKEWEIRFSKEIDMSTLNGRSVFVQTNGQSVADIQVTPGTDNRSLIVRPTGNGYQPGATYFLYINSSLHSVSGKPLGRPVMQKFTVQWDI